MSQVCTVQTGRRCGATVQPRLPMNGNLGCFVRRNVMPRVEEYAPEVTALVESYGGRYLARCPEVQSLSQSASETTGGRFIPLRTALT